AVIAAVRRALDGPVTDATAPARTSSAPTAPTAPATGLTASTGTEGQSLAM
ncbi:hypothetical protein G3I71_46900, partial [Streptomyces sp. SID12501]|nr:hypothetical protein [Streptomyces sp. SID12501]